MKKYKEKYKTGMIFRSKKYPWADIIIDYVSYNRMAENSYEFNTYSIIDWHRSNGVEFDKFVCMKKRYDYLPEEDGRMDFRDKTTFPYPYWARQNLKQWMLILKSMSLNM